MRERERERESQRKLRELERNEKFVGYSFFFDVKMPCNFFHIIRVN